MSEYNEQVHLYKLELSESPSCSQLACLPSPAGHKEGGSSFFDTLQATWAPDDSAVLLQYQISAGRAPRHVGPMSSTCLPVC